MGYNKYTKIENQTYKEIINFLSQNKGKRFTVRQLYLYIQDRVKVTYATVLKWVEVAVALKKIRCEDYRVVKIVWYPKEEEKEESTLKEFGVDSQPQSNLNGD